MSTVDEASVLQNAGEDPSAVSGSRGGRVNRKAVMIGGFGFAAVLAIAVGIMVAGYAKGAVASPVGAAAPTSTPIVGVTPDPTATAPQLPKHHAGDPSEACDPADPICTPTGGTAGSSGGGATMTPPATPAPTATPTPSVEDRIATLRDESTLANAARRMSEAASARDGSMVVGGDQLQPTAGGDTLPTTQQAYPSGSQQPPPPTGGYATPPPLVPPPSSSGAGSQSPTPSSSPQPSRYAIREGDSIDVILQPNVDTDRRGGIINFYLAHDVIDSDYGAMVLLPAGSPGIARVTAAAANDRVIAFTFEKVRAAGRWIPFTGAIQADNGDIGLSAKVNDHRGPLFVLSAIAGGLSALNTVVSGGQGSVVIDSTTTTRPPVVQEVLGGMGSGTIGALNTMVAAGMNRPPSLTIQHATLARLQALNDIPLPPFCDRSIPTSRECRALDALSISQSGGQ